MNFTKYNKYRQMFETQRTPMGFIDVDHCDSLLFTGLVCCVEDVIDSNSIHYYKNYPDRVRWLRRPSFHGACYNPDLPENKESLLSKLYKILKIVIVKKELTEKDLKEIWYKGSTISRDQLLGLAYYAWYNNRLDISEDVVKYALKHFGKMGEGDPARTNIMPALLSTFAWISYKLGGPSRAWLRWVPVPTLVNKDVAGFKAHLQVLHMLLRRNITGKRHKAEDITLEYHANRQPSNPLFAYAVGDTGKANRLLNDPILWPDDRLPTNRDRSESWLTQRDYGSDWLPDLDGNVKIFNGGDYLFTFALVNGRLKK
jgi:hypothetical protein